MDMEWTLDSHRIGYIFLFSELSQIISHGGTLGLKSFLEKKMEKKREKITCLFGKFILDDVMWSDLKNQTIYSQCLLSGTHFVSAYACVCVIKTLFFREMKSEKRILSEIFISGYS